MPVSRQILRFVLCTLLMVGYGGMYAGSILHDLGHNFASQDLHSQDLASHDLASHGHHECGESLSNTDHGDDHTDVSCFFCSHSQVLTDEIADCIVWTPSASQFSQQVHSSGEPHSASVLLSELRGPPAVRYL